MKRANNGSLVFGLLLCLVASPRPAAARTADSTQSAAGDGERPPSEVHAARREYLTHCGLYCVHAALRMAGKGVDFTDLVKPEYYGSYKGSSLLELKKAAEDHGLYAMPVARLTANDLLRSPYPIILHVKSTPQVKEYDHYELFLNSEARRAKVVAPPDSIKFFTLADLVPRWDGNGLVLSAKPIDSRYVYVPRYKRMAVFGITGAFIILAGHFARRRFACLTRLTRRRLLGLSAGQVVALAALAFWCGVVHHFANDAGFLVHPDAVHTLRKAHAGHFIPKISEGKVDRLLGNGTLFVDARLIPDYQAGHLKGAVNIPVDANDYARREQVKKVPMDAPIVVYCQSAACPFAEKVALRLVGDGFLNVSIFKGGWMEWVSKHQDDVASRTPEGDDAADDHA